ncbi:SNF2-related protein [Actinoplanes sp. TFC3]|uniref:SNF2-related protein n=1 Tax=Actinoplanes sp. TFC3 TaxID=1710355 RepID=UPI0035183096
MAGDCCQSVPEAQASNRRNRRQRGQILPLMLRRRKADVVIELPANQQQVIELDLNTRRRRLYQTYLKRK